MKYLGNGMYQISNKKTGETKTVKSSDLSQYGLTASDGKSQGQESSMQGIAKGVSNVAGNVGKLLTNLNLGAIPSSIQHDMSPSQMVGLNVPVNTQNDLGTNIKQGLGAGSWALGGGNPAASALERFGIGAASGLGQNVASGKGGDLTSDAVSTLLGGTVNTVLPAVMDWAGSNLAKLSFGKAGGAIPDIVNETGDNITGIATQGSKDAADTIGNKIDSIYSTMDSGASKDEALNFLSDIRGQASGSTNLEQFLDKIGIKSPEDIAAAKQFVSGQGRDPGDLMTTFENQLQLYAQKDPGILSDVAKDGYNAELPAEFWQQFKTAIKPSQEYYDALKVAPDAAKEATAKVREKIASNISDMLEGKLGQENPEALDELQKLNKLYGPATNIAKGNVGYKGGGMGMLNLIKNLGPAGALVPSIMKATTGKDPSPYVDLISYIAPLLNPSVGGTIASGSVNPEVNAIMNGLTSLLSSRVADKVSK